MEVLNMFNDGSNVRAKDYDTANVSLSHDDGVSVSMTGHIIDKIYKNGKLIDVIEGHNIVVNSFTKLAMALIKGESGFSGATYWAVGSGEASWDTSLPDPKASEVLLTNEIGRVALNASDIVFLNNDLSVSNVPTNMLQIKHLFGKNDCNGKWREFGIFGGNATADINSGILIDKKHHAIVTKTSDMTIERTLRFTLNLV